MRYSIAGKSFLNDLIKSYRLSISGLAPLLLLLAVISSGLLFMMQGCVPSKPTEEVEILPSERLIKKLEANRRKVKTFEGTGSLEVSSSEFNGSVDFKTVLLKPDSLYVELYGPFGIDLAQILITGRNYSFYDIMHNTLYRGRTDSNVLKKVFKIDLSFNDIMDAFIGSVNLTSKLQQEPDKYEIAYNKYVLTYRDSLSGQISRYRVDIRDLALTEYQLLDPNEKPVIDGKYSGFKFIESIPVPHSTELTSNSGNQSIKIDYKKITLNKKNIRIKMTIPDDVQVID